VGSLELFGLAILLFASTNVDDMFVLVGFFADPKFEPREIVIGQYDGITALVGVSVVGSLLALVISRPYIGLFGIGAIGLGLKKLFDLYRDSDDLPKENSGPSGRHTRTATVALVTLVNGADNIGIYMPAFAVRQAYEIGIVAVVFGLMTSLWCFLAHRLVQHPRYGALIRRHGRRVGPLVLIGIGVLIIVPGGQFRAIVLWKALKFMVQECFMPATKTPDGD
jgi:cadmium resistance protein CadD (predicted permease)